MLDKIKYLSAHGIALAGLLIIKPALGIMKAGNGLYDIGYDVNEFMVPKVVGAINKLLGEGTVEMYRDDL